MTPEQANADTQTVHPVRQTVDFRVEVEPPAHLFWSPRTQAERLAALRKWLREMNAILGDHHSLEDLRLTVHVETGLVCSGCGERWELWIEEGGQRNCGSCGVALGEDLP